MAHGISKNLIGDPTKTGHQILISECWIPGEMSANTTSYILKQLGAKKFIVENSVTHVQGTILLQGGPVTAAGQARIAVTPYGATGTAATLNAVMEVKTATFQAAGTGYVVADTVTLPNGVVLTVATIGGAGEVATFTLTNKGTFAASLPTNPITPSSTSGTGTGATFNYTGYDVKSVTVTTGGTNYTAIPNIVFAPTGATATATISAGHVATVTVGASGTYTVKPTVTAVGGNISVEYLRNLYYNTLTTYSSHVYKWNIAGTATDPGSATIPLA